MPVILATQETEIRRITILGQLKQIVHKTLSWKYPTQKKGWRSGLSDREPAFPMWGLEFKPQRH
jgi:hypothetical protein